MGGEGSGPRWGNPRRILVEDCFSIKAEDLKDIIRRGGPGSYQLASYGRNVVGIYIEDETPTGQFIRLKYNRGEGEKVQNLDYRLFMERVVPHFGGVRWYFQCPLVVNGRFCGRRSAKLYLPSGGLYFGCRTCYNLTYTSSRESHKFDRLFRTLAANMGRGSTPAQVKAALTRKR